MKSRQSTTKRITKSDMKIIKEFMLKTKTGPIVRYNREDVGSLFFIHERVRLWGQPVGKRWVHYNQLRIRKSTMQDLQNFIEDDKIQQSQHCQSPRGWDRVEV